jgi:HlyD family secretion protein
MYLSKAAKLASLCALFLLITACEEEQGSVPTYEVSEREFKISVSAFG